MFYTLVNLVVGCAVMHVEGEAEFPFAQGPAPVVILSLMLPDYLHGLYLMLLTNMPYIADSLGRAMSMYGKQRGSALHVVIMQGGHTSAKANPCVCNRAHYSQACDEPSPATGSLCSRRRKLVAVPHKEPIPP